MLRTVNVERTIVKAIGSLILWGALAAPACATYGGAACHSRTPAPVIATQFEVACLAPRVETVLQTVYETVYVNELPSNELEMMLWLESERMAKLKIDEGGFDTERKVVEEERRMGLNQPYGDVLEKLLAQLFREHPYRWSPIGQIEHLRASTPDDIQKFWDKFYVPNNCTLVVTTSGLPIPVGT